MGIRELRVQASQLGIKNYSKMNKVELEAAIAAVGQPKADAKTLGEVAGRIVLVSASDSDQTIGELLGTFSKSDARKVRKLFHANGMGRAAALPRIVSNNRLAKVA